MWRKPCLSATPPRGHCGSFGTLGCLKYLGTLTRGTCPGLPTRVVSNDQLRHHHLQCCNLCLFARHHHLQCCNFSVCAREGSRVFQFMCECTALRTRLIIALQVKCSTLPRPAWIIREGRYLLAAVSCRSHVKVLSHRGSQDRGARYCPREVNNLAATCLVGREGRSMLASCVRW